MIEGIDKIIIAVLTTVATVVPATYTFLDRRHKKIVPVPKLEYHPRRFRMAELLTYLKTSYRLPNKGRTALSRDHLIWKLTTGDKILSQLERDVDSCVASCKLQDSSGCTKLLNMNLKALNDIVVAYNDFENSYSFNDSEKESIREYMPIFNEWHSVRVSKMENVINTACSSEYYKGAVCTLRQAIIEDNYTAEYAGSIKDAEDVMPSINGRLTGKIYKGEVM